MHMRRTGNSLTLTLSLRIKVLGSFLNIAELFKKKKTDIFFRLQHTVVEDADILPKSICIIAKSFGNFGKRDLGWIYTTSYPILICFSDLVHIRTVRPKRLQPRKKH